jgi:hypothetical protein
VPITTAVCPEIQNEEVARQVKAEQANLLYRYAWAADWPSAAAALAFLVLFWTEPNSVICASCAAFLGAAALARAGVGFAFRRRVIPVEQAKTWQLLSLGTTAALAIGWGSIGAALLLPGSWDTGALPAVLMAGVAAIALPLLSPSLIHYFIFVAVVLAPSSLRLLYSADRTSLTILTLLAAVAALLCAVARAVNARLVEGLNLRFSYATIVEELTGQVSERTRVETKLREGEERMRRQSQSLLDLARESTISGGDIKGALTVISEKAAQALNCRRICVWFLDETGSSLRCAHVFSHGKHRSSTSAAARRCSTPYTRPAPTQ